MDQVAWLSYNDTHEIYKIQTKKAGDCLGALILIVRYLWLHMGFNDDERHYLWWS